MLYAENNTYRFDDEPLSKEDYEFLRTHFYTDPNKLGYWKDERNLLNTSEWFHLNKTYSED